MRVERICGFPHLRNGEKTLKREKSLLQNIDTIKKK